MLQLIREKKYPIYPALKVAKKRVHVLRVPTKKSKQVPDTVFPAQDNEEELICLDLTDVTENK